MHTQKSGASETPIHAVCNRFASSRNSNHEERKISFSAWVLAFGGELFLQNYAVKRTQTRFANAIGSAPCT